MLKHLNPDEMVGLTTPLVGKTKRRATFLSIPEIAPLHAKVVQCHKAMLAVRPAKAATSPELQAVVAEGSRVDKRHDHLARAIFSNLEGHEELCLGAEPSDTARAAACAEARKRLFPNGLQIVNVSPLAESGNATRIGKLLDEDPRLVELLKSIPSTSKATLFDTVQRWTKAGREVGKLDRDREELEAKLAAAPAAGPRFQEARGLWLRVISGVLSALELSDAPAEAIEAIRGPILRASERAGKRYASDRPEEPVLDPAAADEAEDEGPQA
ncbi:MAG TPA: hypothetical protein VLS89_07980 [Candidatus Nanopelagicales bacterium]|nr:hypothetical protein [Candidatus Nanopelagicales bacterium]